MGRLARKTKTRAENIMAWLFALGGLALLGLGIIAALRVLGVI